MLRLWHYTYLQGPQALALLFVRIVVGSAFLFHGWPKIQHPFSWMGPDSPVPGLLQALAGASEFLGGLAILAGAFTCIAALAIAAVMLGALLLVHWPKGDPFIGHGSSWELPAVYLALMGLLLFVGAGTYSLDAWLLEKPKT